MAACSWKTVAEGIIGHPLKAKQIDVLQELVNRRHTFAAFPTGFGKSCLFGTFPAVYQHMHPEEPAPIALVITPLNALSANHVLSWTEKGVKSVALKGKKEMDDAIMEAIIKGEYTLMFASPEIIQTDHWWDILKGLRERIQLLVIDEVHTLTTWGKVFRPDFLKAGQLRGILHRAVTLALTATATRKLIQEISMHLGLEDRMKIISLSPDRPEIFLKILHVDNDMANLAWYGDIIREQQHDAPRAIIYSRHITTVTKLYFWLDGYLGNKAIEEGFNGEEEINGRFIEMYHGLTDSESQERIVQNFRQPESPLRCVVATVAFGLGVDIPNIRYVLHWGPPKTVLAYWQETGRCSRDSLPGQAILYVYTGSDDKDTGKCMKAVISCGTNPEKCIRDAVLSHMDVSQDHAKKQQVPKKCCFNCSRKPAALSS